MALRVVSVTDIFSEEAHIDHCGLLIISERAGRDDRELPIIILPRSRKRDKREEEEEEKKEDDRILYWSGSVGKVEHYTDQEFGFICFYFNAERKSSSRNRVYISPGSPSSHVLSVSTLRPA